MESRHTHKNWPQWHTPVVLVPGKAKIGDLLAASGRMHELQEQNVKESNIDHWLSHAYTLTHVNMYIQTHTHRAKERERERQTETDRHR